MPGPEEWPSCRGDPADRIRLTGPAANLPQGPSLHSGFRLRARAALTPANRLNLQVRLPITLEVLRGAQDFGCGLRRRQQRRSACCSAVTKAIPQSPRRSRLSGTRLSYHCAATAADPSAGAKNTTTESRSLISQNECCSRAGTNMIVPGPTSKVLAFPSEPVRILAWPLAT